MLQVRPLGQNLQPCRFSSRGHREYQINAIPLQQSPLQLAADIAKLSLNPETDQGSCKGWLTQSCWPRSAPHHLFSIKR